MCGGGGCLFVCLFIFCLFVLFACGFRPDITAKVDWA